MIDLRKLPLVLATLAVVLGVTLAIAGSGSTRLERGKRTQAPRPLTDPAFVSGLSSHRFRVTAHTLRAWLAGPTPPVVVDLRARAPYQVGHVSGALSRPFEALLLGKITLGVRGRQVVLVDQDGRLAPYLIHPLRARGIDAYLLAGGYAAWMAPSASRQADRRAAAPAARRPAAEAPGTPPETLAPPPTPSAAPPPPATPRAAGPASEAAPAAEEGC